MKPRTLLLSALLCLGCKAFSQTPFVVSAGGGTNATPTISLEWTLGEPAVESSTTSLKLLTQGFHQPLIIVQSAPSRNSSTPALVTVSTYPNPVQSLLNVQISSEINKGSITLVNMQGTLLFSDQVDTKRRSIQIDMQRFAPSVYFLNVRDASGKIIHSSKIIKAN